MTFCRALAVLLLAGTAASGAELSVTVFDEKTGRPVPNLRAENFVVMDGDLRLTVNSAEFTEEILDLMLIADASFLGEAIQPILAPMIRNAPDDAQIALVTYDQSATLVQDFTNDKDQLLAVSSRITHGNNPRVLDALYAVLDGGFEGSPGRRVAVVLSSGAEGRSRSRLSEVVELAQRRDAAVFVAFAQGVDARLFQELAEKTGGAWFHLKKLKLSPAESAALVHSTLRGSYTLDVSGASQFGDRLRVETTGLPKSKMKIVATVRPLD